MIKQNILKATAIIAVIFTSACSGEAPENHDQSQSENTEVANNTSSNSTPELVLNDDKRWIANPETTNGVRNMVLIMTDFAERDGDVSFETLHENLNTEFNLIFRKCTMTGEAHNQLHNFLIPVKSLLADLNSTDARNRQETYDQLFNHLNE
jgi:hypothetical protein